MCVSLLLLIFNILRDVNDPIKDGSSSNSLCWICNRDKYLRAISDFGSVFIIFLDTSNSLKLLHHPISLGISVNLFFDRTKTFKL
ncbi:hypothetical protein HERIO_1675 [Hepatospora eriocheir]|uniref:Uncharacterized protein n=1 Tax=Hepatospora eriocheir TaxID=1081669 RepID=A0A1X0Q9E6_9MICR|nr:hypothetical protein HERIO_1675 [Hepatospora eriocheir]